MKILLNFIIVNALILFTLSCKDNINNIEGQWEGVLNVGTNKLNLVFDFTKSGDSIIGKFYSIDQTNEAFECKNTIFFNDTFSVEIPKLHASYKGILTDSKTFMGMFTQGGSFPLEIKKKKGEKFDLESEDKYLENNDLYTTTNVKIQNKSANVVLAGTVTMPKEGTNLPAVILVSGSGPQDRNETIMEHKPFHRIADFLACRGFAVLRYDDRGCFSSTGNFADATTHDFLTDAIAAVGFMKSHENIDPQRVGVIGHSEGGLIAMMGAAQDTTFNFIVSLAGPTIKGEEILILQSTKIDSISGVSTEQLIKTKIINSAVYTIVKQATDLKKAKLDIIATIKHYAFNSEMKKDANAERIANTVLSHWFRTFIIIDPADYLVNIECPTLIMFGEKDLQIPAEENRDAFYKMMSTNIPNNFTLITIEGVNHLFQKASTGLPSEYSKSENETMNNETLNEIYKWLENNIL